MVGTWCHRSNTPLKSRCAMYREVLLLVTQLDYNMFTTRTNRSSKEMWTGPKQSRVSVCQVTSAETEEQNHNDPDVSLPIDPSCSHLVIRSQSAADLNPLQSVQRHIQPKLQKKANRTPQLSRRLCTNRIKQHQQRRLFNVHLWWSFSSDPALKLWNKMLLVIQPSNSKRPDVDDKCDEQLSW